MKIDLSATGPFRPGHFGPVLGPSNSKRPIIHEMVKYHTITQVLYVLLGIKYGFMRFGDLRFCLLKMKC